MPSAAHPRRRDFYVYVITAAGVVFYVGIGRAARASDRLRWVRSQVDREKRGLPGKWTRHTAVIAKCIGRDIPVKLRKLRSRLTRRRALAYEKAAIARYLRRGYLLANYHHNPGFKGSAQDVVRHIRGRDDGCT